MSSRKAIEQENLFFNKDLRNIEKNHEFLLKHKIDIMHLYKGIKSLTAADFLIKHYTGNGNLFVEHKYLDLCKWSTNALYHPNNLIKQGQELISMLRAESMIDETNHKIYLELTTAKELNDWKIETEKNILKKKQELTKKLEETLAQRLQNATNTIVEVTKMSISDNIPNIPLPTLNELPLEEEVIELKRSEVKEIAHIFQTTVDNFYNLVSQMEKFLPNLIKINNS